MQSDGRHPNNTVIGTIKEDAERRDFGINALYFSLSTNKLIDPNNKGIIDYNNKHISFVGNVESRLDEDMLRLLRYLRFIIRFSSKDFTYDKTEFQQALKAYKPEVVSVERIYQELEGMFKVIENDRYTVEFITRTLKSLNLFKRFTMVKVSMDIAIDRMFDTLDFFPLVVMLEGDYSTLKLGHEFGKLYQWFEMFKDEDFSNIITVKNLLTQTDSFDSAERVLNYFKCFNKENNHKDGLIALKALKNKVGTVDEEPYKITQLKVNGGDMMKAGYKGVEIGVQLDAMLKLVIKYPELNTREKLMEMVDFSKI